MITKKYAVVFCEGEFEDYLEDTLCVVDTRLEAKLIADAIQQREQPWFDLLMDKWAAEKYLRERDITIDIIIRDVKHIHLKGLTDEEILSYIKEGK